MQLRDTCHKCGAPAIPESNSRFCLECGADLRLAEAATVRGRTKEHKPLERSKVTEEAEGISEGVSPNSGKPPIKETPPRKIPKFAYPIAALAIAFLVIGALLVPVLTSGRQDHSGGDISSEYVGEWYVPTDTDRRIVIDANGEVTYGDDNHGTIAKGKWAVIDEDTGAIKFILEAQDGNERMFQEGPGEFTRMAYAESAEKLTVQMYYSPSEWETYIKK